MMSYLFLQILEANDCIGRKTSVAEIYNNEKRVGYQPKFYIGDIGRVTIPVMILSLFFNLEQVKDFHEVSPRRSDRIFTRNWFSITTDWIIFSVGMTLTKIHMVYPLDLQTYKFIMQ